MLTVVRCMPVLASMTSTMPVMPSASRARARSQVAGDPNGLGLPTWPVFTNGSPVYLQQDISSVTLNETQYRTNNHCDFWDPRLRFPPPSMNTGGCVPQLDAAVPGHFMEWRLYGATPLLFAASLHDLDQVRLARDFERNPSSAVYRSAVAAASVSAARRPCTGTKPHR